VIVLCVIGVAVSIRRLVALAAPPTSDASTFAQLDAFFGAKPDLTRAHVVAGLLLAAAIPVQLSSRVRTRYPAVHRWLGRLLLIVGVLVGGTGYAMTVMPVGGWIETSAIVLYATLLIAALVTGWWHIRNRRTSLHREWMLRAIGIALGVATTRPVIGVFFATSPLTGLTPPQFFGAAMWIGFTWTALAAEAYVRWTRPHDTETRRLPAVPTPRLQGDQA
jgi:hypothetical protein